MTRATPSHTPSVLSLLDTDLYKLTMQCAVLKHFPDSCKSPQSREETRPLYIDAHAINGSRSRHA